MVEGCSRQGASHARRGDIIVSFVPLFLSKQVTTSLSPHPMGPRSTVHVHLLVHAISSLFTFWLFVHHTITTLANVRVLYSVILKEGDFVDYSTSAVVLSSIIYFLRRFSWIETNNNCYCK